MIENIKLFANFLALLTLFAFGAVFADEHVDTVVYTLEYENAYKDVWKDIIYPINSECE